MADNVEHCKHGGEEVTGQPGHVVDHIPEVKERLRIAGAVVDWELTKLEGAQC